MNSTWGWSISKPKVIKNKYVQNPESYIQRFGKFVIKQKGNFVSTVNCFVPHYSFPQFAKSVLDEYNKFFDGVKRNVKVYYENIDAILTDEEGFNKLNDMGLIDNEAMGKFKIDKIFTEFAAISDRKWVATTMAQGASDEVLDGEQVMHGIKDLTYDEVVEISKKM